MRGPIADALGRLLVVDDIEENRDLLQRRLQRLGYEVAVAASGQEALDILSTDQFDLALLDIMMPDMSGLETLERLRADTTPSSLPVIMVSAKSESEDVVQALALGASDFITKPIDFPVAFARIETHLALRRADDALRNSEARFALAMEGATEGIWDWDLVRDEIYFSRRWKEILGHTDAEFPNTVPAWFDRIHEDDLGRVRSEIKKHLDGISLRIDVHYRIRHANESYRWIRTVGMARRDDHGTPNRMAGSISDITEQVLMDPLTDIPNRTHFEDSVERAIALKKRNESINFGVVVFELDAYANLKTSVGHSFTEQLLQQFADRLKGHMRTSDGVALIGENSFGMLVEGIAIAADAVRVAERARDLVDKSFDIFGREISTTISAGITTSHSAYESAEDMLRDAMLGLRSAQELGGDTCQMVNPQLHAQALERLNLEADLRRAAATNDFEINYQPIVDLGSGYIRGFEALLRWNRPDHGPVSPAVFIPIAERTGLINSIGNWVLAEACGQLAKWQKSLAGNLDCVMNVNVSPRQFQQPDLFEQITHTLDETGLDSSCLKVEITESVVLEDFDMAANLLNRISDQNIRIAIDDFGTGYSSLRTLLRVPIDTIKIDRSFTMNVGDDDNAARIVSAIVHMAESLGKDVVAEGIETPSQAAFVGNIGAQYGQGYLYSKPVVAAEAFELLKKGCLAEIAPARPVEIPPAETAPAA